ncbi:phosphopantetheine-binding protein [Streptomyces sp. NPDC002540]
MLSGEAGAIAELEGELAAKGVTVRRLQASGAFHTPLLKGAQVPFARALESTEVTTPSIDVYGNADGSTYPADPGRIRERLADHLISPVLFADQVEAMYAAGIRTFVEVGAGATLTRLVGDGLGERPHSAVSLDRKGRDGVTVLHQALGRLAVAGVPMEFGALWEPYELPDAGREASKSRMSLRLSGANYGRPDPATVLAEPPVAPAPPVSANGSAGPSAALDAHRVLSRREPAVTVVETAPAPQQATVLPSSLVYAPAEAATPPPRAAAEPGPLPAQVSAGSWVHAFEETQRQAAEAHTEYQRLMAEAHHAFLESTERSLGSLLGMTVPGAVTPGAVTPSVLLPSDVVPGAALPATAPIPRLAPAPQPFPEAAPFPAPADPAEPTVPTAVAEPAAEPMTADPAEVLYDIVAERTGYPRDILEPHMHLEADLGIDSIKRVEILANLHRRAPPQPRYPHQGTHASANPRGHSRTPACRR